VVGVENDGFGSGGWTLEQHMASTSSFKAAWLNAQYNNRARVPDHADYFARWALESQQARDGLACALDVPFVDPTIGLAPPKLDVFPSARPNSPVLLFIHGGWWRSLDKRDHSFIAPPFVQAGVTVVIPNYNLCPGVGIDTIAWQMAQALAWTHRHVAKYGGDPQRIVVAGHSAGGHLAAMLLCCDGRKVAANLPAQMSVSALSISGVFDMQPLRQTPFLRADLKLTAATARRVSPAFFPAPRGRLSAVYGELESEEFARQSRLIQTRWGRSVVPVCEAVPDTNHFSVLNELADSKSRLHQQALQMLLS
jgi:arylformamidase